MKKLLEVRTQRNGWGRDNEFSNSSVQVFTRWFNASIQVATAPSGYFLNVSFTPLRHKS